MFDIQSLIKYILEGLAVAVATWLVPKKKIDLKEVALIALTAAAIFAILDQFSPMVATGARQGAGFGIGYQQIGLGGLGGFGLEGFDDQQMDGLEDMDDYNDYNDEGFQDNSTDQNSMLNGSTDQINSTNDPNNIYGPNGTYGPNGPNGPIDNSINGSTNQMNGSTNQMNGSTNQMNGSTDYSSNSNSMNGSPSYMTNTNTTDSIDSQNACSMNNGLCTYDQNAGSDQRSTYLCRQDNNNQCAPVRACQQSSSGICDWNEQAMNLPDAAGRTCQSQNINGDQVCRLANQTETFVGNADEIAGFEGFSKVF
jgi:hypothetical protein